MKHYGWISLWRTSNGKYVCVDSNIFETEELARENADDTTIAILPIEWEETENK